MNLHDPHDQAALRNLHRLNVARVPGRPRKPRPVVEHEVETAGQARPDAVRDEAEVVDDWVPIEWSGPNEYGERRWRCSNPHSNGRRYGSSSFADRVPVQRSIANHMAAEHRDRDPEAETSRVP